MCVFDLLYNVCLKHFIFYVELSEIWSKMSSGLHVNYRYSCPIWMKLEFSLQDFEKDSNRKFHENSSSWNSAVACEQMDGRIDWRTDNSKLIVAFGKFAKASNKCVEGRKLIFFIYNIHFAAPSTTWAPPFKVVASHVPPDPNQYPCYIILVIFEKSVQE
jgi:hypothetical protein